MKKLFILFMLSLLTVSCSKDDEPKALEVHPDNLNGVWYFKEVIKSDGSIVSYINSCPTEPDNISIDFLNLEITRTWVDCASIAYDQCTYIVSPETRKIMACDPTVDGTVTELTADKLKIEYGEVRNFGYTENNFDDIKGIILAKE